MGTDKTILKKKALPCKICEFYGGEEGKCNCTILTTADYCTDDFGVHYCHTHKNKYTGEFTKGYKLVEERETKVSEEVTERNKVWFCSDLHFSHTNSIHFHPERLDKVGISYEVFKEKSVEEMDKYDKWLIEEWNKNIKKRDTVYFLGDFCLSSRERTEYILNKLHGKKFLIRGNHDKSCNGLENYFEWVGDIKEAKFTNNQFKFIDPNETFCVELCHYPLFTWNRRAHGSCMVHGHCHGSIDMINTEMEELRVDVGYDGTLAKQCGGFIELEDLYKYFCNIRDTYGCKTFKEYAEKKMNKDGFRM